ncbi:unnamed protein product [Durusdinium trenchii]|uniref:Uncharacterized protein n=1 Tax=Durusdinium trenchii TaxID=1381693 RepID=A0ABP0P2S1_9DINO
MACDKSAKCYPGHVVQIQTSVLCRVILYTKNDASAKKYTLAGLQTADPPEDGPDPRMQKISGAGRARNFWQMKIPFTCGRYFSNYSSSPALSWCPMLDTVQFQIKQSYPASRVPCFPRLSARCDFSKASTGVADE